MSQADEREPYLPPDAEAELLAQLEAALRPGEVDADAHERLLAVALEDPLANPSAAELVESTRLRDALAGLEIHPDAEMLRGLAAPFRAADDAAALERALGTLRVRPARSNVVYVAFGLASAVATAAAVVLLWLGRPTAEPAAPRPEARAAPQLIPPRSTAALFEERFETRGTSARMDRIASARARDLRDNRYASWGVR